MRNFVKEKGTLEFVLGSGWLSLHEASRLAPGMVLRSSRLAGTGYELRFGGERIADASAVALGDADEGFLCAQLQNLERGPFMPPEPARGSDLMELLPFSIVLGSAEADVESLSGLGRMSVVDLGIKAGLTQDAILLVAGIRTARGIVSVQGERMALRLTEIEAAFNGDAPFRTTGALVDPGRSSEKIQDYDFRRPDCFTRGQLEAFAVLHADFLGSLGALLDIGAGAKLARVDQMNFTEFAESLQEGELIVAAPCSKSVRPRVPESDRPRKTLLRLSDRPGFPEAEALDWVRREQSRPMGGAVLAAGGVLRTERDSVFSALRDAWKSYGALAPFPSAEFRRTKEKPAIALGDYSGEWEMVAVASFDLGGAGGLDIAYPLRAIEPALKALTA